MRHSCVLFSEERLWQQVVNPLGTCDNEKTGAIAIEET
jgi:hypothetical protein